MNFCRLCPPSKKKHKSEKFLSALLLPLFQNFLFCLKSSPNFRNNTLELKQLAIKASGWKYLKNLLYFCHSYLSSHLTRGHETPHAEQISHYWNTLGLVPLFKGSARRPSGRFLPRGCLGWNYQTGWTLDKLGWNFQTGWVGQNGLDLKGKLGLMILDGTKWAWIKW